MAACYERLADGLRLTVRVTPRAARDSVDGVGLRDDGSVVAMVRIRAAPADGAANKAVISVLAKAFRRPKSALSITSGATSRIKRIHIEGDADVLAAVVDAWPDLSSGD